MRTHRELSGPPREMFAATRDVETVARQDIGKKGELVSEIT